jgi:beta-galactosidase
MKIQLKTRLFFCLLLAIESVAPAQTRQKLDFTADWRFSFADSTQDFSKPMDDSKWRQLNLPHDWSIEGTFSKEHPSKFFGGALPGGLAWYRKTFTLPKTDQNQRIFVDFDGIYRHATVFINGKSLGTTDFGYASFRHDLTPYLKFGGEKNILAVQVDNSKQPNSRWYSGSGIYRNVWLVKTAPIHVAQNGSYISTPSVLPDKAIVEVQTMLNSHLKSSENIVIQTIILDEIGKEVLSTVDKTQLLPNIGGSIQQRFHLKNPQLWTLEKPYLYRAVTKISHKGKIVDTYETSFGIRSFHFDRLTGFHLNGVPTKIKGVCMHHDLGCLGAVVNVRAMERQLEILKKMGCNAIRTTHNPPAPEWLDLCDKMGFVVMDESFDVWRKAKVPYDYSQDFDKNHVKDLEDFVKRDRNHPSIIMWSIGNEVWEQDSKEGVTIANELITIIKKLDTRPITMGVHEWWKDMAVLKSADLDLFGFNYGSSKYDKMLDWFPNKPMILTETVSALQTRGHYDMPSDSIRRWPVRWDLPFARADSLQVCSAYDHVSAPWGNTHEEMMRFFKKNAWMSGMFVWTGFDYIGEPTPYEYPARSSYFGIIDLAGFPKDVYHLYKSEWTTEPVLHLFPHWNWAKGQIVDIWAYSNADEVELFLNDKSLGINRKEKEALHFVWRVPFTEGVLKAVSMKKGKPILTKIIQTADKPAKIQLIADRHRIQADGKDLCFVTIKILDKKGNLVPNANHLVKFDLMGAGDIVGVDNGSQTSHESFKSKQRNVFNGQCLLVIQSQKAAARLILKASSEGLPDETIEILSILNEK